MRTSSELNADLIELHARLIADDPVVTEDIFAAVAPMLESYLRRQFPSLAPGVDPDIYLSATHEALTNYFKAPHKYVASRSGLVTYLRLAAKRDLQNLLRKESRHAKGRVSLESVEFQQSDGNDISDRVAEKIDGQRLIDEVTEGMTNDERAVFRLMLDGERSTKAASDAIAIGHLPPKDQAIEVKRVKDRIKKRIRRKGLAPL